MKPNPKLNVPELLLWNYYMQGNRCVCIPNQETATGLFESTHSTLPSLCVYHLIYLGIFSKCFRPKTSDPRERKVVSICFQVKWLWLQWECSSALNQLQEMKQTCSVFWVAFFFYWCIRSYRAAMLQCDYNGSKGKKRNGKDGYNSQSVLN